MSEVLVNLAHLLIPRNQAQEVGRRQGEGPTEEDLGRQQGACCHLTGKN